MPPRSFFQVNHCCGCFSLQTGTLIIGILTLIKIMIEALHFVFMLIHMDFYIEICTKRFRQHVKTMSHAPKLLNEHLLLNKNNSNATIYEEEPHDFFQEFSPHVFRTGCEKTVLLQSWIHLFVYLIYFILTSMMISGAKTKRYRLMKPWLMWVGIHIIFAFMYMFWSDTSEKANALSMVVILSYFAIVVNSHYHELQQQEEEARHPAAVTVVSVARSPEMVVTIPSPHKTMPYNNYNGAPPPYSGYGTPPPSYQIATNSTFNQPQPDTSYNGPLEGATALPPSSLPHMVQQPETSTSVRGIAPLPVLPYNTFQVQDESPQDSSSEGVVLKTPRMDQCTSSDESSDDNPTTPLQPRTGNESDTLNTDNNLDTDSPSTDNEDRRLVTK